MICHAPTSTAASTLASAAIIMMKADISVVSSERHTAASLKVATRHQDPPTWLLSMPCVIKHKMEAFGTITRRDRPLSEAAKFFVAALHGRSAA